MDAVDPPLHLSVEFQLTEADVLAYVRYRQWHEPQGRRKLLLAFGTLLLFAVGVGMLLGVRLGVSDWTTMAVIVALLALAFPLFVNAYHSTIARNNAQMPEFKATSSQLITPEGIYGRRGSTEARRDWKSVTGIVGTVEHLFFYLGSGQALIIPRRAFPSPAAAEKYLVVAREYWAAGKDQAEEPTPLEAVEEALGPERVRVDYTLTTQDFHRFQLYHLLRQPRRLFGLAVVLLGVAGYCWFLGNAPYAALRAPVIVGGIYGLIFWAQGRALRNNPAFLGPHTVIISPSGYWARTVGLADARIEWSAVTEVVANAEHILLFRGPNFGIIIPKRAFLTPQDADRFLLRACEWQALHAVQPTRGKHGSR